MQELSDSNQSPRSPLIGTLRRKLLFGLLTAASVLLATEVVLRVVVPSQNSTRFQQINQIVVFLGTNESDLMLDFDPERFWKLKPNIHINDAENTFWQGQVSNSLGYRSPEFTLARTPGTIRVVCFGDSSTFGIGTTMQDTWPSQLQTILQAEPNSAGQSVDRYEVINAGVPGYTSYQGLQYMRQEIDRLQPDIVLASYANNDFWHWDQQTDEEHAKRLNATQGIRDVVLNSRLAQVIDQGVRGLRSATEAEPEQGGSPCQHWAAAATQNYFEPLDNWTKRVPLSAFQNNINQMTDLCDSRNVPMILVKWPDQPQASGRWSPRIAYQDVLESIAAKRGLQIADVVQQFHDNRSWAVHTYIPNDIVHVNRSGNTLAAIAAATAIRRVEAQSRPLTN